MRLCACHKVFKERRFCVDCGTDYDDMAQMWNGRYISDDLIVKVNGRGDVNVIRFEGNKINASIKYFRGNYETAKGNDVL